MPTTPASLSWTRRSAGSSTRSTGSTSRGGPSSSLWAITATSSAQHWWNKNTFSSSACRPPLSSRPPAKGNGRASRSLVEFVDLYPTLVDLAGLDGPDGLAGVSLRGVLDDPSRRVKDAAFTTVRRGNVAGLSVRTDRYRYTEWDEGENGAELYDHEADPGEWHNLADDPGQAPALAELAGRLSAFRRQYPRRAATR